MSLSIYSWNEHSEGARALANELDIKRIKHTNSRFRGNPRKTVINWGNGRALPEEVARCKILNDPDRVQIVSNKRSFFYAMSRDERVDTRPRLPEFTDNEETARNWVLAGETVCIRSILQGSGVEGLIIVGPGNLQEFVRAPLYVKYVKKISEYRVHVVNAQVIDVQKKAKRTDHDGERNTQIRNLANGYIYARGGFTAEEDVVIQAKLAMAASGLTFGAVDVIYNRHQGHAFVLEINSAPGLQGSTLVNYANAFRGMV